MHRCERTYPAPQVQFTVLGYGAIALLNTFLNEVRAVCLYHSCCCTHGLHNPA